MLCIWFLLHVVGVNFHFIAAGRAGEAQKPEAQGAGIKVMPGQPGGGDPKIVVTAPAMEIKMKMLTPGPSWFLLGTDIK
jgi:hypothetical protein